MKRAGIKTQKKQNDIYKKINTASLALIAIVIATVALIYTKPFVMPLIISLMIYMIIASAMRFMSNKFKMPRIFAASITFVFVAAAFVLLVILISNSISSFIADAYIYEHKISQTLAWLTTTAEQYGFQLNFSSLYNAAISLNIFDLVKNMGLSMVSIISYAALCFIFLIFFFLGEASFNMGNKRNLRIVHEIQNKISYYIIVKILISVVTAFVFWLVLAVFGVELALIFALIVFILNFIPNIGSIVATILPLPVMFLQFGLGPKFFIVLGLLIFVQFTFGNIAEPKVLGDGVDLHPIFILCALVFWTLVWGVAGAFLAIPLMVAIKIVLSKITPTKPLAEFMAGRF